MNDLLNTLLAGVESVDPALRTLLAGVAMMLETSILIGLLVPGDTIVIVASTAVSGTGEYIGMVLAVIVGALTGESIGFVLGRHLGPRIRVSRLGRRIGEENWARAERYLQRRGGPAVFLSRFIPVLHSLVPVTVGMSAMTYRRFISWTIPACLLWTGTYVSVASAAAEGYRELSRQLHFAGYLFVGVIVAFLGVVWLVKTLLLRSERRHLEAPDEVSDEHESV